MTNPAIKECSNPDCGNTWEVKNEVDARRQTCDPCHFETLALVAAGAQPRLTPAEAQPRSTAAAARETYANRLRSMTERLAAMDRSHVYSMGRDAARTAAVIDPRLHPVSGKEKDPLECIPDELLGAAKDLVDYLGAGRVPPETDRHGIQQSTVWDLGHAMHLLRELALYLDDAQREIPEYTRIRCLQELLNLAIEIALISNDKRNHSVLDELVAGRPVNPAD